MQLIEAIINIDKSESNSLMWIDVDLFNYSLDIYVPSYNHPEDLQDRLKAYWLVKWLCTDTWVGVWVYFLDGFPTAVATQTARKNDITIEFMSKSAADILRNYLLSSDSREYPLVTRNEELDEFYTIVYSSQLLTDTGYYNGELVTVVKKYYNYSEIDKWQTVDIRDSSGTIKNIPMYAFKIPLALVPIDERK